MDLDDVVVLDKIRGGSNCRVYKCVHLSGNSAKPLVIKILECNEEETILRRIRKEFEEIRIKIALKSVPVSELLFDKIYKSSDLPGMFFGDSGLSFVIAETYVGVSIRDMVCNKNSDSRMTLRIVKKCEQFIKTFPEGIPMDTNPGNILYSIKSDSFYFIDFLPPNPWEYSKESIFYEPYARVFPTIPFTLSDTGNWDRYHLNKFRLERFRFHLKRYGLEDL